ncbi:MAG TPA: cytochrome b [Paracoccaceae bacterium]|nr:cytochrome b [Paracoccaceae bacterium]
MTTKTLIWPLPVRFLHWLMALLVFGMLAIGFYASNFADEAAVKFNLLQAHKSFGFVAFTLALLRIGLRLTLRERPPLPIMPPWQRFASGASHLLMYVLIVAVPVSGWLLASASPFNNTDAFPFRVPNRVFGLFELPDPILIGTEALESRYFAVHLTLNTLLVIVVLIHIAAALKHHFIDKDTVLNAMLGRRG